MLQVDRVSKRYKKGFLANDNLSFTLEDKQVTILLGANGAGKSTIIKCIVGFLNFEGTITLDGLPVGSLDVKKQIAYVPEVPELYDQLTINQHFAFIAHLYGITDYQEKVAYYLDKFHLTEKQNTLCSALSKGMRQKVSLISALFLEPRLLILDEPLIGLDPSAIRTLRSILEAHKQNCSILICTHLIDSVVDLWDQVIMMKQGQIVYQATRSTFNPEDKLEDIYFRYVDPEEYSDSPEAEVNDLDPLL